MLNVALQPLANADDRSLPRYRLLTQAEGRAGETMPFPVTLHNLSATGLLVEVEAPLAIGATLVLDIPGAGEVDATVVWSSDSFYGAAFDRPLSHHVVRTALASSKVVWPAFQGNESAPAARLPEKPAVAIVPTPDGVESQPSGWSIATRVQIIAGISTLLWIGIAGAATALLG